MKTIQRLTVLVMMTVMVYTASLSKDLQLKDIHDAAAALNRSTVNTTLHLFVKKIEQDGGATCVDKFFCLAEKSLNAATKKYKLDGKTLIRRLNMFNKKFGTTHCHLATNKEYTLKEFLGNITRCADQMINQNHQ